MDRGCDLGPQMPGGSFQSQHGLLREEPFLA